MTSKLAVKRLAASDLTLFEWQFQHRNVGGQKSINLNADVFVDSLFPAIAEATRGTGMVTLDLTIFGPGNRPSINLQRKIIKRATYKNWRLDGETIRNPEGEPTRFNLLDAGDYAIFAFEGEIVPSSATALFVARAVAEDAAEPAVSQIGCPIQMIPRCHLLPNRCDTGRGLPATAVFTTMLSAICRVITRSSGA